MSFLSFGCFETLMEAQRTEPNEAKSLTILILAASLTVLLMEGRSLPLHWLSDASTILCLVAGAGLDKVAGYSETTSDSRCTQYSSADCEKYWTLNLCTRLLWLAWFASGWQSFVWQLIDTCDLLAVYVASTSALNQKWIQMLVIGMQNSTPFLFPFLFASSDPLFLHPVPPPFPPDPYFLFTVCPTFLPLYPDRGFGIDVSCLSSQWVPPEPGHQIPWIHCQCWKYHPRPTEI